MIRKTIAVGAFAMLLLAGCRQNVAPEPAADIASFMASPVEVAVGAEVAFSWELADNGAVTVGCTLTPAADAEPVTVDCEAGSYAHVYETAGEMTATLTVLSEPDHETNQDVTVTVTEPEPEPEAPLVEDDELTVDYDSLASFDLAAAMLANDEPVEGALELTGVSGNEYVVFDEATGVISIDPTDALSLDAVPAGGQEAIDFDYTATNGAGLSASASVSLTVAGTAQVTSINFESEKLWVKMDVPEALAFSLETHGDPDVTLTWSFEPEGIAEFDDEGNLVGITAGQTVLTAQSATNEAATASIAVSVVDPMIIDIDTSLISVGGPVAENQFYLFSFVPNGEVWVDWGDGSPVRSLDEAVINQHTYETAGEYTVLVWSDSEEPQTLSGENASTPEAVKAVRSWGNLNWVSLNRAFQDAVNLEGVPAGLPAGVTSLEYMFYRAYRFNGDISGWDTSNVKRMDGMFRTAVDFNQDLSDWDTSNVTSMYGMFEAAENFNGSIGDWDTGNVTNFGSMFRFAYSFNQDIGDWDVSATGMTDGMMMMFQGARNFSQDLSSWCVDIGVPMADFGSIPPAYMPRIGDCG